MQKRILLQWLFGVSITLVLLYFVFRFINVQDLVSLLRNIAPSSFMYIIFLLLFNSFFKTLQMHLFTYNKMSFYPLFLIVNIHNLAINLLPLKLGEGSFLYLTRKIGSLPFSETISALLAVRIFEGITFILVYLSIVLFTNVQYDGLYAFIPYFTVLLLTVLVALLSLLFFHQFILKKIEQLLEKKIQYATYFLEKIRILLIAFTSVWKKEYMLQAFLYTICDAFSFFFLIFITFKAVGIPIQYFDVMLLFSIIPILSFLPIHGVGGFGSIEVLWSLVLIGYGISINSAMSTVFLVHSILLLCTIIIGVTSVFLLKYKTKNKSYKEQAVSLIR